MSKVSNADIRGMLADEVRNLTLAEQIGSACDTQRRYAQAKTNSHVAQATENEIWCAYQNEQEILWKELLRRLGIDATQPTFDIEELKTYILDAVKLAVTQ